MINQIINTMSSKLKSKLSEYSPSMMIYGSITLDDFCQGWSDIDFLLLTEKTLDIHLAQELVTFRQQLSDENCENFRLFEGSILSKKAFLESTNDVVVYWGTSGQRIMDNCQLDVFSRIVLLENGELAFGDDFCHLMSFPKRAEIINAIKTQLDIVRKYGNAHAEWLFNIARCLYTLQTNQVISKTKAGEWAISQNLCPNLDVMKQALKMRKSKEIHKNSTETKAWFATLNPFIQSFADVLERELKNY